MVPMVRPAFRPPLLFLLLYGIFLLCFVVTPLWNSLPGLPLKGAFLAMSLTAGFLWAWLGVGGLSGGGLRSPKAADTGWFLLILLLLFFLERRPLLASIPWRGDEEYHIRFTSQLAGLYASHPWYPLVLAGFLALGCFLPVMNRKAIAAALLLGALAAMAGFRAHLDIYHVLRYPIFLKYLAAFPVYLSSGFSHPFPEIPFRLFPLLSGAGLSWLGFHALAGYGGGYREYRGYDIPIRIAAGMAVATLPLLRYYNTYLYLEMPAVFCMSLVCFQAVPLLRADLGSLTRHSGWYALLLIGFIKETTLPFLAAFLCCRLLFRLPALLQGLRDGSKGLWQHWRPWRSWLEEAAVIFCVGFPLFFYICYRLQAGISRGYLPEFSHVLDAHLLFAAARSWWDSFGLLLPLALAGALLALRRRKWETLLFPGLAFVLTAAFHLFDLGIYIGYSRFNLFLLPCLLALSWQALRYGAFRIPAATLAGLALLLAGNIILSPVNADGSKKPHWGVYGTDVGDHAYPYREAVLQLKQAGLGKHARLTGLYYPYPTGFYLEPDQMPVQSLVAPASDEAVLMDSLLAASDREGFTAVLYHVLGDSVPVLKNPHGYGNIRIFRNQAHALVLFSR
ncbi:MAG: hypothetical protein ABI036_09950 [Fibrobacteria bacterium]